MGVPDLTDYRDQVVFLRRLLREGRCERIGTWDTIDDDWSRRHGDLWVAKVAGFIIHFESEGRHLVAGSFRARPM